MISIVFVLFFYIGNGSGGGPTVIDNIATYEECVALGENIKKTLPVPQLFYSTYYTCQEVKKKLKV